MQTQDQQPDFIPISAGGATSAASGSAPDFIPFGPPAPQHGAFVRFMSRAAGVPEDVFDNPNKWLNPFSAAYNSPQHQQEQQQAFNPSIQQMQPTMPGAQTVQDIKGGNYAGAAGDVLPGLLAALQTRAGLRIPQPEVLPPSIAARPRIIPSRTLPPAPSEAIPMGPSSLDIPTTGPTTREGVLPAKSITVGDGQGGLKKQYLTSAAKPDLSTPYTLEQGKMINALRAELESQPGTSLADQEAVNQRMEEYARTPWESETPAPANETPLQKYIRLRAAMKPAPGDSQITVYPNTDDVKTIMQQGAPVTQSPQRTMSSQIMDALSKFSQNEAPQVVGNGDLTDVLTRSVAKARAAKNVKAAGR